MKIPFISWTNILNSKVKFWHMIWIDTWGVYLQVCITNMLVYIQPLCVTKENFLLRVPLIASNLPHYFCLYPYYILSH